MSHKTVGFVLGIFLFVAILSLPPIGSWYSIALDVAKQLKNPADVDGIVFSMKVVFALLALMVSWWLTEAVPLPVTALLPAVVLPGFQIAGVHNNELSYLTFKSLLANYAHPIIYLFLGGFLLAAAMKKWKLDLRFTLWFLTRGELANDSRKVLLGIMCVTAFLSMWISNTATAAIMLPLGIGILTLTGGAPGESKFGTALMLGIAWAASVGGIGTIIGTPPNGIALGILNSYYADDPTFTPISFLDWMKLGVPFVILFLPIIWIILLKLYPPEFTSIPGGKQKLLVEKDTLGKFSVGERGTLFVFCFAVFLWLSNPFWETLLHPGVFTLVGGIDEYSIGLIVGVLLFLVPVNFRKSEFVLKWSDAKQVEWGTLILFGGGIALSDAMFKTGIATWIAHLIIGLLGDPSTLLLMFVIVLLVDFLTEITSNTAVTSMIVPIIISIAVSMGKSPVILVIAAAVAASMAYMLPVATPPNALVYGSGYVKLKDMIRAGFVLDIVGWLFTIGIILLFGVVIFGMVEV